MFYPELLEVIDKTGAKELIEKLDKYFAFLPNKSEKIITVSNIATRFEIDFSIAESLLKHFYELELLNTIYIVCCPNCGREILKSSKSELMEKIKGFDYCIKCKSDVKEITIDDIYVGYILVKSPDLDEESIIKETEAVLGNDIQDSEDDEYNSLRKLFDEKKEQPNDFFYKPSKVDMLTLREMFEHLDDDYGSCMTAQGGALEGLACKLFSLCVGMKATPIIRTPTNQIDCTVRNDYCFPLTVYNELGSIIKVECKNEPNSTPKNTYYHKLYGILNTSKSKNEQSIGILFTRKKIPRTCTDLARQYFLQDNIIIINIFDEDLNRIINKGANFLEVLQEKIQTVKNNIITDPENHRLFR